MSYDTHPSTGPQDVKAILKLSSKIGEGAISLCVPNGMTVMIISRSRNITLPPVTFKHRIKETATHLTCVLEMYG